MPKLKKFKPNLKKLTPFTSVWAAVLLALTVAVVIVTGLAVMHHQQLTSPTIQY